MYTYHYCMRTEVVRMGRVSKNYVTEGKQTAVSSCIWFYDQSLI